MVFRHSRSQLRSTGNLGTLERWASIGAGVGLTLLAARSRSPLRQTLISSVGLALLGRGAAGHCGMKAALTGQSSLAEGLAEQWQRLWVGLTSPAAAIEDMQTLYIMELQELCSAERQIEHVVENLARIAVHPPLASHLRGYATELRSRTQDIERILSSYGVDPREHPDQAMRALIRETYKMATVCAENVRDTALASSLQRLLHYRIAGYGTVAAYAKALGRVEEASRFAEYADRDKAMDAELTELAVGTLNPEAREAPQGLPTAEPLVH